MAPGLALVAPGLRCFLGSAASTVRCVCAWYREPPRPTGTALACQCTAQTVRGKLVWARFRAGLFVPRTFVWYVRAEKHTTYIPSRCGTAQLAMDEGGLAALYG